MRSAQFVCHSRTDWQNGSILICNHVQIGLFRHVVRLVVNYSTCDRYLPETKREEISSRSTQQTVSEKYLG